RTARMLMNNCFGFMMCICFLWLNCPLLNADVAKAQCPVSEFRYGQFVCYRVSLGPLLSTGASKCVGPRAQSATVCWCGRASGYKTHVPRSVAAIGADSRSLAPAVSYAELLACLFRPRHANLVNPLCRTACRII